MKIILILISILIITIFLILSCSKKDSEGCITINHKKERHHATFSDKNRIFWHKKSNSITLVFDESCRYNLENGFQRSWNKIYGKGIPIWKFIDGSFKRKRETLLAWRYNEIIDKIEIAEYSRKDYNLMPRKILGTLKIGQTKTFSLEFLNKEKGLTICPYFGGKKPAPHNMYFKLKL